MHVAPVAALVEPKHCMMGFAEAVEAIWDIEDEAAEVEEEEAYFRLIWARVEDDPEDEVAVVAELREVPPAVPFPPPPLEDPTDEGHSRPLDLFLEAIGQPDALKREFAL